MNFTKTAMFKYFIHIEKVNEIVGKICLNNCEEY